VFLRLTLSVVCASNGVTTSYISPTLPSSCFFDLVPLAPSPSSLLSLLCLILFLLHRPLHPSPLCLLCFIISFLHRSLHPSSVLGLLCLILFLLHRPLHPSPLFFLCFILFLLHRPLHPSPTLPSFSCSVPFLTSWPLLLHPIPLALLPASFFPLLLSKQTSKFLSHTEQSCACL